jgi:hypothetical protein
VIWNCERHQIAQPQQICVYYHDLAHKEVWTSAKAGRLLNLWGASLYYLYGCPRILIRLQVWSQLFVIAYLQYLVASRMILTSGSRYCTCMLAHHSPRPKPRIPTSTVMIMRRMLTSLPPTADVSLSPLRVREMQPCCGVSCCGFPRPYGRMRP